MIVFSILFLAIPLFGGVSGSRYGVYEGKVRIVFELTQKRDFKVFTLENPRRIVIDIYGERNVSKLSLPVGFSYRVGKHPWGVRIVLLYPKSFSLKYFGLRDPYRIVLDIYRRGEDLHAELVKDPIGELIKKVKAQPLIYEEKVIVIDPGHGGRDPGAIGRGGLREKDINLAVARKVAEFLRRDGRFRVILTRDGDYWVSLSKRAEIALKNRADLFISIHADAAPGKDPRAKGTHVFALSYRRAMEKKRKILRDRRYARLVLGDGASTGSRIVKKVLADLAIDVTLRESVYFGRILSKELRKVLGRSVYFKGIKRAGFVVLRTPGIPSVLVEMGFITNPSEARKLKNPGFQKKMAWSIYRAVVRYFYGEDFGRKLVKYR